MLFTFPIFTGSNIAAILAKKNSVHVIGLVVSNFEYVNLFTQVVGWVDFELFLHLIGIGFEHQNQSDFLAKF